jgi:hypothetical protein
MEQVGDIAKTVLISLWNFGLFIVVSLVFLPSFLIVTYLQDYWSKKLSELFGV